jgi:hypothetical protein
MADNRKSKQAQIDELQYRATFYAQILAHIFNKYDIECLKISKDTHDLWGGSTVTMKHRFNPENGNLEVIAGFEDSKQ